MRRKRRERRKERRVERKRQKGAGSQRRKESLNPTLRLLALSMCFCALRAAISMQIDFIFLGEIGLPSLSHSFLG